MIQSRFMSLVESITNVVVGFGIAILTQVLVFPIFGFHAAASEHLAIAGVFTVVSLARSFLLRRFFEAVRVHADPANQTTR
ncbi:MAG: hypothetical protein Q8Q26_18280 [Pseudorhodobacter sp.]|nr:hypothetical protein [Pseudorhodobacter sp.]